MQFSKFSIIGPTVLVILIAMSFYNYQILLDQVLACSFILGMAYIYKMLTENFDTTPNTDNRKHT